MRGVVSAAFVIVFLATCALAQTPQRRIERVRLDNFIGRWTLEVEEEGVKYSMTETCDWFAGEFHMVCQRSAIGGGPMAALKGQKVFAYDAIETTYTLYSLNSFGSTVFMRGSVEGPVWTWYADLRLDGQSARARLTTTERSPTSSVFVMEISVGGAPWRVVESGRATKVP